MKRIANLDELISNIRLARSPSQEIEAWHELTNYMYRARVRDWIVFSVCLGSAVVLVLFANKIVC